MGLLADDKFEATLDYEGRITIGRKSYFFKKGETFSVNSEKHLAVINAEQKRRTTLQKG